MTYLEDTLAHGLARHKAGQLAEAQTVYEAILSHSHNVRINGIALSRLADLHLREARLSEAREAAQRAIRLNKDNGSALLKAAQIERTAGNAEGGIQLLTSRSPHQLPPLLIEELGLCWQAIGEYRKAFLCFKEAKRRISFTDLDVDRHILTRYMEKLANRYAGPEALPWTPTPPLDRPSPVFLIGFNESGLSELGHMLDLHPGFSLAPEVPAMDSARQTLSGKDPEHLHTLTPAEIQNARTSYFKVMDKWAAPGTVIVDALPFNGLALALIHRLFPEAIILRCIRHPCEAVLRTFCKTYAFNAVTCHFDRLERTATAIMATTAVSAQIEASLSMLVHPIRIEEFLAEPQSSVAAIAQGAGLDASVAIPTPPMSPVDLWPKYRAEMSRWLPSLLKLADQLGYPEK